MRSNPISVAAAVLLAVALGSQAPGARADEDVGDYVTVKAYLDQDVYRPGQVARVAIEFRVDPRVHVNSHAPTDEFAIPTSLTWTEVPEGAAPSEIAWPEAEMKAFAFTEGKKIPVLEGRQRAHLSVRVSPDVEPGTLLLLEGTFRAQGCTNVACYAPQKDPVKVKIRVVGADEAPSAINDSKFPPAEEAPP